MPCIGHSSPSAQTNTTLTLPTDFPCVGDADAEPAGEPKRGLGRSDGRRVVLADLDGEVAGNHRVDRSRVVDHRPGHPGNANHGQAEQVRAPDTVVQGSLVTLCLGRSATGGRRHCLDLARWLTSGKPAMTGSGLGDESGSVTSSVLTQRLILTGLDIARDRRGGGAPLTGALGVAATYSDGSMRTVRAFLLSRWILIQSVSWSTRSAGRPCFGLRCHSQGHPGAPSFLRRAVDAVLLRGRSGRLVVGG